MKVLFLLSTAAALLVGGCNAPRQTALGARDPADPRARTPAAAYRPVTGGYEAIRPAEARDWREMNRRVAPQTEGR